MTIAAAFKPYEKLAARLLAEHDAQTSDGSHDLSHTLRVWRNAARIAAGEGGSDLELLVAAVILHDCVAVEKNSPLRSQASRLAASRAVEICAPLGFSGTRLDGLAHAIATHSFSAGLPAETLEARILQDADRLDAIGAIGIARCFYVAGRLGTTLYDQGDPTARNRAPNDAAFALDHFDAKLFKLTGSFQTASGGPPWRQRAMRGCGFLSPIFSQKLAGRRNCLSFFRPISQNKEVLFLRKRNKNSQSVPLAWVCGGDRPPSTGPN